MNTIRETSAATATAVPPVLSVSGVEKAFGTVPPWRRRRIEVLRGASLDVGPGELVGLVGENVGQLGATYLVLFMAMLGMGILQNPMFGDGTPGGIAVALPEYGAGRVIVDASFAEGFHAWPQLLLAIGWVALLGFVVAVVLGRALRAG